MSIDSVFFIHFNPGKTRLLREKRKEKKNRRSKQAKLRSSRVKIKKKNFYACSQIKTTWTKKKQNKKQNGQFRLSNVSFLPSVNRPALV
jgi:Flp pilus assembly protein TadB